MPGKSTDAATMKAVLVLMAISVSLPSLASASPVRDGTSPASTSVLIVNGTSAEIGYLDNAFIYCRIQLSQAQDFLHHYTIEWQNSSAETVPTWSQDAHVYTIGRGSHVPHSYLVFQDFTSSLSGNYSCSVKRNGVALSSSRIAVR
ncbi:uncharacterized protein LOC135207118 [Macrobrachium nipponense]|uniref:uncharacterized protein LOC135207118 n=1 Tax=Macrobrachium nipponense TaxID=159736 RepID=UPI0030C7F6DE